MDNMMYVPIAPGIKMQVPVNLTVEEINQRITKYQSNLERDKEKTYNPRMKTFTKNKI